MEPLQGLLERGQQHVVRQARAQAEARARRSFLRESQHLLLWAEGVWAQLRSKAKAADVASDVASAQRLLMEHRDLLEEIQLQQERSGWEADRAGFGLAKACGDRPPERERQEAECHPG